MTNLTPRPNVRLEQLCDGVAASRGRTDANSRDVRDAKRMLREERRNKLCKPPIQMPRKSVEAATKGKFQ
jgi:hypothetical protein